MADETESSESDTDVPEDEMLAQAWVGALASDGWSVSEQP